MSALAANVILVIKGNLRKTIEQCSVESRRHQEFQQNGSEVFADKRNPKTQALAQGDVPDESPGELKKLTCYPPLHNIRDGIGFYQR